MHARESARRARCANNLKQIGVAMSEHIDNKRAFPQIGGGLSPFSRILPHLDQEHLYNSINFEVPYYLAIGTGTNQTAYETLLDVFICPSDGDEIGPGGPCNYGGNVGFGFGPMGGGADNGPFASAAGFDPEITTADIRDGLSHTVAVSEFCRNQDLERRHPKRSVFDIGEIDDFGSFTRKCVRLDPRKTAIYTRLKGRSWLLDGLGTTLYNHNLGPNGYTCGNANNYRGAWTAASFHRNGVHALFCDGRVAFIKDTINIKSWHAVGSMQGGEVDQSER